MIFEPLLNKFKQFLNHFNMLEKELKKLWQDAAPTEKIKFEKSKLLIDLDYELKKMERQIKNRDLREIIVALLLIPFFIYLAINAELLLSQIAAGLLVIYCCFVIYKLRSVKRYKKDNFSGSLKEQLQQMRIYVQKERNLLDTVLYWYLLPAAFPILLFFGSTVGVGLKLVIYGLVLVAVFTGIYFMNKNAVKQNFDPVLEQLDEAIGELNE